METRKALTVATILAMAVTLSLADNAAVDDSDVVAGHGGHQLAQTLQAKMDTMDEQLWGTDETADLIQVEASSESPADSSLRLIEEDALKQAGFVPQPASDDGQESANAKHPEEAAVSPIHEDSDVQVEALMEANHEKLLQMKMREHEATLNAEHEKAKREVLEEGIGDAMQEQQQFFSYMSRWWRLHRKWMKRHNVRLYQKLREHRALSLSSLWKPFLLRWHYVQPRLLQGYRYNWNDDGTYETKRFLMKSTRKDGKHVAAARIRSLNNICFPGLLTPEDKNKLCKFEKRVSARAAQFTLERAQMQSPSLTVMRAYASFIPNSGSDVATIETDQWTKAKPGINFVSIQGMHWELLEVIEYCNSPVSSSGVNVPAAYSTKTSSPIREYSLKFMEWKEIQMGQQLLDTGATVENIELKSTDQKIRISCVIPVDHPQNIDGRRLTLTQQKCSFYIRQWDFNLQCPAGTVGTIALKTMITARDDSGDSGGKPTMTPDFKNQLSYDKNKVSMQFEKQAVLHVHDDASGGDARSSVPVSMTVDDQMQWTSDPRFKTSRNVYFSFIVSDISKIKNGVLVWDPEARASFKDTPTKKLTSPTQAQQRPAPAQAPAASSEIGLLETAASMQLKSSSASTNAAFSICSMWIFVAVQLWLLGVLV
jgi:hypothetical protein